LIIFSKPLVEQIFGKKKKQKIEIIKREGNSYVIAVGPRRGFSLKDWKENLFKKGKIHRGFSPDGQSLTYMV
jgi:hypothetical protein